VVLVAFAVATALGTSALAQVGAAGRAAPGLVGLSKSVAAATASRDGLALHITHRAASDPKDIVLEQHPAPGDWLYGGHTIDVVLSLGPSKVRVPNVLGMSLVAATAALARVGLVAKRAHRYDEATKAGDVFHQDPSQLQELFPGQSVTITYSDGPAPVKVPDVHGESCAQAAAQLAALHLKPGCTQVFNADTRAGDVVTTVPGPDTIQKRDTPITIQVSKGPELVKVPDVRGFRIADALKKLKDLGFNPSVPNYNPKGHVFDQTPKAGQMIPKGSTVTLIL
jgi:eukaryotic-like serine/threonine-protein kinase